MTSEPFLRGAVTTDIPLESADEVPPIIDDLPPPYQHPKIEFNSGWKDCGFAIAFWLHVAVVIILSLVLGRPIVFPYVKQKVFNNQEETSFDTMSKALVYPLVTAAITGGVISFFIIPLLQICAGRIIICLFIIIVIAEIIIGVLIFLTTSGFVRCIPLIVLFFTLIFICVIRDRIPFAEAHLRVGSAVLRSHLSLIFVAFFMFLVELLWLMFWCFMVVGVLHASDRPVLNINNDTTLTNSASFRIVFGTYNRKLTPNNTNTAQINNQPYLSTTKAYRYNTSYGESLSNTAYNKPANTEEPGNPIVTYIIIFFVMFSWYWGAITFANIVHFVTAGTVGQWWFNDDASEQYAIRTSMKRALTTNFGTICFGSLLEAFIKALKSMRSEKRRNLCIEYILSLIEKMIGYLNDWAIVFAALIGESFIKACRSFTELFRKRGWDMIINDSIVEYCLAGINIVIGVVSATVGCLIMYLLLRNSSEEVNGFIIRTAILSFLVGILMSTIITTILNSSVRAVFVCFALNPAALAATHPEHMQSLITVWQVVHPKEFASSGYDRQLSKPTLDTYA
jgi:hypothetical protein